MLFRFQSLLKDVKNIQLEFEESTATFGNKLTTRSLEYLVRALLTSEDIDKLNYRYCELIQNATGHLNYLQIITNFNLTKLASDTRWQHV